MATPKEYEESKNIYLRHKDDAPENLYVFNGNDYVYLRLTDKGIAILREEYGKYMKEPTPWGLYRFQFHEFMNVFGKHRNGHSELYHMDIMFRKDSLQQYPRKIDR